MRVFYPKWFFQPGLPNVRTCAFLIVAMGIIGFGLLQSSILVHLSLSAPNAPAAPSNTTSANDAVIILGGGLNDHGQPHEWVKARLDLAATYNAKYYIVLSRGTTHKPPPTDKAGFPIDESVASAKYLVQRHNISKDRIIGDTWSLDTIGNAYFVVAMICDPLRLQNVIVVTSQFHMERTKVIFEWLFPLWMPTGTLGFAASRDRGLDTATLALRNAKEAASVKSLKVLTEQHRDKLSVAQFVMLKHSAYVAYVRTGLLFTVDSVCEDCHTWPCNWL
eukprot:m.484446 g.484446  ORF g.484446 m.484446 type:complete len:277 (-) comp21731_c3_seq10:3380-4210(-)